MALPEGHPLLLENALRFIPPSCDISEGRQPGSSTPQALGIDSEDDLYQLVDFFQKYKAQEVAVSQVGPPGTAVGRARGSREGAAERLLNTQGRQREGDQHVDPEVFPCDQTWEVKVLGLRGCNLLLPWMNRTSCA